jgi:hypothetical protein
MALADPFQEGLIEASSQFVANDFRIKRALDSMIRSAAAIDEDMVIAEDLMGRLHTLRHLLREVGHAV